MTSPTRTMLSPSTTRVTTIIQNTTVISPRSIPPRSQLEESISTLQNEQERVQKKTFTKWVNIYLSLHEPPYYVSDLFEDLRDGTKLIALLEVLSGQTLPTERGKKRAHCLSNVDNALKYLESRKIKLVNIRPIDIVDGKPMMILGLIWMLILYYQIDDSSMFDENSKDNRNKAKEALLEWVRKKTSGYYSSSESLRQIDGLNVRDFTTSWRDGLAFNALIHSIRPDLVDLRRVTQMEVRDRLENAFNVAEKQLGVPRLIDAEDVDVCKPDEKSIMTYLAQFSRRFPDLPFGSVNKEHGELLRWVSDVRQRLTHILEAPVQDVQLEYKEYVRQLKEYLEKQKHWKAFERKESKSPNFPGEKLKELKEFFDDIVLRMNRWRFKLDTSLPGELRQIVDWINMAEEVLARNIDFDPLTLPVDENIQRFTQLNEEHNAVFTDKEVILRTFQRLKRDPSVMNRQISSEHATHLNERLEIIVHNSDERGCFLDFEELHWRVQKLFLQLEYFIIELNKKLGDLNHTERLYIDYQRKIYDEKLHITIESFLPELVRRAQNYSQLSKKDDHIAKEFHAYCDNIRRVMKTFNSDLKGKEILLQDTIQSWKIYYNNYESFEKWLNESEHVLRRSSEEKVNFFVDLEHWSQVHEKLRLAIERLITVCHEDYTTALHNKLLFINRRWKEIVESVQQFKHDESIKKKRDEFYAGRAKLLDTLDRIDREIQDYLPCTIKALKDQENRLYEAQAELDMFSQTVQVLSRLSQTIARESGETNASSEMNSLLQICFDRLHAVQESLPNILRRNKLILGHLQKFDDGLQKCNQWFNEARQLMNRYTILVPVERIDSFLEQHRNFFADIGYYQSFLDSKGRLITTMKKSNESSVPVNFSPIDDQYKQLLDTFEQICQQASYWEKEFNLHMQLWRSFDQRLKHLKDWIEEAQNVIQEKNDDHAYLIQKHKNFFQLVDDEIFHGFIKAGRELLHIRDQADQKDIQLLMDTLESKWQNIMNVAPLRLLRLQYERVENIIVKELKQAEDECNEELHQLERQYDSLDIMRRHNEHFQSNNFLPTIETHMRNLYSFSNDIRLKETDSTCDNERIDQRTLKINEYWTRTQAKIESVRRKLQTIPKKWQEFEERFRTIEIWMKTVEQSMNDAVNNDLSFDQYKLVVNKFKNDVQQIDTIANDVKALSTLLDELIEERATDDPVRYRQRVDALHTRYRHLLTSIDETSHRCTIMIPAKMIHENSQQLYTSLTQITNAPTNFRDLSDVRTALQGQMRVCEVFDSFAQQVNDLVARGDDLLKQPMIPKYVHHDTQALQKLYRDKVESAQETLAKFKHLLELWELFEANKRRFGLQIDRLNNEYAQLKSNQNSIISFQHEIENAKYIRTSYADLKLVLDENGQCLQQITSNNLLPYESLQKIKIDYDNMIEELTDKLRLIDDFLQDLINDNDKWNHFNEELKRLETLFREIGSVFDAKMFGERGLEEKQQILERIRIDLGEHLHALSVLYTDGLNLESLHSRPKELQNVLSRLTKLRELSEVTSGKVHHEEELVVECRTHVQMAHRFIQQLQPWIEQAEYYLTKRIDQIGAVNLTEAKQLHDDHKDFLEERRRMSCIYNNILDEERSITDQYELKSLIKSLSARWLEIVRKSDELTPRYEKQYSSWLLFESELNSFRDQLLVELEKRVLAITSVDVNKILDLARMNALLNELRALAEHINTYTPNCNRFHKQLNDLKQYCSAEGQRILHEEQVSIETQWTQINRSVADKLREVERLYESRKAFHTRFEALERNVRDIAEQIENNGQIQTASWRHTLQRLQQTQKQLETTQPIMTTVRQDIAELELSGLLKSDLQTIQNTFDTYRQRINTYETLLRKRVELLQRYEEHMKCSLEMKNKLQKISDEIQQKPQMKVNDIELVKAELENYITDLRAIQTDSNTLDRLMEESSTAIIDSSTNRNIFFVVEFRTIQNLLDSIDSKLYQRRVQAQELERLLDEFGQSHTSLLRRINALSSNLRTARLVGYSSRDIEDIMGVVKTLHREIQGEDANLNTLRVKYKTLSSDLTNQERQDAENALNKIQTELERIQEEIEHRNDRLSTLNNQRQELDQNHSRFMVWLEDKQRLISPEQSIPLKGSEVDRLIKKYTDTLNEIKLQRTILDNITKLNEHVKQGYHGEDKAGFDLHTDDLAQKMNKLEETLIDLNKKLQAANEQRSDFDRILTKLNDWIKTCEQQIKEPFANDLQQATNALKEKAKIIQSLLQATKDRKTELEDLTRIHGLIGANLNDAERIALNEKYNAIKDKYHHLLDSLTQRMILLDEAIHERIEFEQKNDRLQELYQVLQNEFGRQKQMKITDINYPTNERRLEQFKQLSIHLDEIITCFKELTHLQRLLTNKGHRIDFRIASELNANIKNLDGQIHNEIERIERALQAENDFYHIDNELDSNLQFSAEQLKTSQEHRDKGIIFQSIADRLQQSELELSRLIQLNERLVNDLPRAQYEQLKRIIERRQERLQAIIKACQNARGEHEHMIKTQQKLNEDLILSIEWFRRLAQDLNQSLELNLSLNNVTDLQESMNQLALSVDQRLMRIEQAFRDEPNLINSSDTEIRERLMMVEDLKHQVKIQLNKQRIILDDVHKGITHYLKLTNEVKTIICDADFKLSPYFDGYDRKRLDEHERGLNHLEQICNEQKFRLVEAHKIVETFRLYLRANARELCENQLKNFQQTVEDLETRILQRRKEVDEIRQKSSRFSAGVAHLQSDAERILLLIEKSADTAESLISELDASLAALQHLGRDLKRSLDASSSSEIDRELKDLVSSVDVIHDSLDRAKRSQEENESIRDRIERILNKIKSTIGRKRQELHQNLDTEFGNSDLIRRSSEMKNFTKELELESSHLVEVKELILTLNDKKCEPQLIRTLEKKQEDIANEILILKTDAVKVIESLERQIQEQEKLRQHARTLTSVIQRAKLQLFELRPTMNVVASQKLEAIDQELVKSFQMFDQALEEYKSLYGNLTDDMDKTVLHVYEDIEDIKARFNEKSTELNEFNILRDEYETCVETVSQISQSIEAEMRKANMKLDLEALKGLSIEMQAQRSLMERLQILSSTLTSQITDVNERDSMRRRLTEIARQWTELEQNLITDEEEISEMNHLMQQYRDIGSTCEHWLKQTKDLMSELTAAKTIETLNHLIPKAKTSLTEFQFNFEHLERLKNRLKRFIQTNRTPETAQKLNEIDRLLQDLLVTRDRIEQCLDLSHKVNYQLNEFEKQFLFYDQWINNTYRTVETIIEENIPIDEKLQRLHDIQIELDKRKQILNNLGSDYPQIEQLIVKSIQSLIVNIDRIKSNITRKQEEYEQQNRQQKDFRGRLEELFESIRQTHIYEPFSDKRDIDYLQRECARLNEKYQQISEKSQDIEALLRIINSSKLPSDSLQRLRQEVDHLKERLVESSNELETRINFIKKTIRDADEQQRRQRRYHESPTRLASPFEHDAQIPGRSVEDALKCLDDQMNRFKSQSEERERRRREREREWHLLIDELGLLQDKLNTLKKRKINIHDSIEEQLHFIRNQNQELNQYQEELTYLKTHGQNLCLEENNTIPLPSETHLLQSSISFLKQQLDQLRETLLEAQRCRDIYLNECKLYEDAYNSSMERLSHSIALPSTIDEYTRQLNEHKNYNQQLDEQRRRLNFLYDKLDRDTRAHYAKQYHDIEKRSNDLQDRMTQHTIRLEYYLQIWKEYQTRLTDVCYQLHDIEKQLPAPRRLVAFQQIQPTFTLYKELKQRLVLIQPELIHLHDEIQGLGRELNLTSLLNDVQNLRENFSRFSSDIQDKCDCHKVAVILTNDIKRNLAILEDTLGQCTNELQIRYDGDINELKIQLDKLMDVEKRLENIADVYSNTITLLKRLATFGLYDLQSVETHLENFHHKWTSTKGEILRNENTLHQNIINKLPSRQACKEMCVFIDTIKRLLDDDHGALINNKDMLQKLIRRYRDMHVDILNRQRTMDFLNESFQQESNVDLTSIDYMENIKQINTDWIKVKSLISARIETLEQLNQQFNEFDQTVRTLSDWVQEQTSDLEFMRTRHLEAGAKDNLRRINEMEYQLTSKQQVLSSLKTFNGRMTSSSSTFRVTDQLGTIENLRHMLDHLTPAIEQLKTNSKSIVTEWQEYNRVLLQMEKILREAETEIDRVEINAMNIETYEMGVKRAQEYLQAMESHREDFEKIANHERQLFGQCDGQTSSRITEISIRIQQRWAIVQQNLQEIIKPSRDITEIWKQFNSFYVQLLDRLGELEARWYSIQREKFSIDIDALSDRAKEFQQRLEHINGDIVKLHDYSKKLTGYLPAMAAKKIDTQYSLVKNQYSELENIQHKLLTDCTELKHREKFYLDYSKELTQAIQQAQNVLKSQRLTGENENIHLKQLRELDIVLQSKRPLVERLSSNEFMLYVKRTKNMHEYFLEYSNCIELVKARIKQIEVHEQNRMNFEKRCQKWNDYVQAVESNLSVIQENLPTNYHGLLEIETNLSNTINDFNQRQQELIDLIHDGKRVIDDENMFIKLEQRWQIIMNTFLNKQKEVKELIQLWLSYQNYLENYYRLLKTKCDSEQKELQAATVDIIQQLRQGSFTTINHNSELKNLLEKIYETNRRLVQHSDVKTQNILEKELNDLQKAIHDIDAGIKQRREALNTLLIRYNELDRTLDQLITIIKSIRSLQQQPTDDTNKFLEQCHKKSRELAQYRTDLQRVRQSITEITPDLHPDDTRQLIQKLNLLEIQWSDAERSLVVLVDSLSKRRSEYQDFENKFVRFIQWFDHFLNNEINQRLDGLSIQTCLEILKNEIRNIVNDKRKVANDLLIQARLIQSQSTDTTQLQVIKQKIEQLEQVMDTVEQHVEKRIKKLDTTLKMLHEFEQGSDNMRIWMDTIEVNLQRLGSAQGISEPPIHQQSMSAIEIDIEKHGAVITSLLALGQNLLKENDILPRHIESVSRSVQMLEQRWTSLKELMRKRKVDFDSVHISLRSIDEAINRAMKMINDHERFLAEIKRTSGDGLQGVRNEYKSLESFKRTLTDDDKEIQQISNNYAEITRLHPKADFNHEIRHRIKDLTHRWEVLNATTQETTKHLKYMLSVHGDFQLTQDSLVLWLTDLDVVLTNLEHLSEAPSTEKLRQLNDMDREIQDKQAKIEYVQTCANYLLSKTVDARGLTINMNELTKFCQQLRNLTKRIHKLKQNLMNSSDHHTLDVLSSPRRTTLSPTHKRITSLSPKSPRKQPSSQSPIRKKLSTPSPPRSRSPNRYLRSRERCVRSLENVDFADHRQRADKLFADFEDILLQINAEFRAKEESLHSPIPLGAQIENLPIDFGYNRILTSIRRKIDTLHEFINQIQQELGAYLIQNLNNDPNVLEIMDQWAHLQSLANEKDDQLNRQRLKWKQFKRQLENLEQTIHDWTHTDNLSPRTTFSKSDGNQRLDELEILLKSTIDLGMEFNDNSNEWILIEHRLQSVKDKFQYLLTKYSRSHREPKIHIDTKAELMEINSQLDHLETLIHSLEPIDSNETNPNINRAKLHRFIRIHDDLEILNQRLIKLNDHSLAMSSNEQICLLNDVKLVFDRSNSIKRVVRIYLDQLENLLAKYDTNFSLTSLSQLRTSNNSF